MMGGISAAGEKFLRVSRVGVWAVRVVGKKVHGFLRRGCRIMPVANPTSGVAGFLTKFGWGCFEVQERLCVVGLSFIGGSGMERRDMSDYACG